MTVRLQSPRVWSELAKLSAFVRRDFLVAWSYRTAFFGDAFNLTAQIVLFYFMSLMVNESILPQYGEEPTSYVAFVAIGISLGAFLSLGLSRVSTSLRNEQLVGTLEVLYMTPTAPLTIQLGLAVYDLVYIPIRTGIFLGAVFLWFDIAVSASGLGPAALILGFFIPFVWGLGMVGAAWVMVYRRGAGLLGLGALALSISSGAYFPLTLFPSWLQDVARLNPIAVAFESTRQALLGGADWAKLSGDIVLLAVAAAISLSIGVFAVRLALQRERATGTLGRY